ncbi:MAG TPA: hypothetical protein IGS40_20375 [Trichormus sp. M33_DOE_039]|nr:hypothetical protein [Trichormus sp. M33_DOE_039]
MKPVIFVCSIFAAQIALAPAFAIPAGSYTRSCIGIVESTYRQYGQKIGRLSALCRDQNGNPVNAHLDNYRTCSDISNNNGQLVCIRSNPRSPGVRSNPPYRGGRY